MKEKDINNIKQIIAEFVLGQAYCNVQDLKEHLKAKKVVHTEETVIKYLYHLKRAGRIFDTGRGWYSNIRQPFVLDTDPVQEIVQFLNRQFPLLDFSAWGTGQLAAFFHHLQASQVVLIDAAIDLLPSIFSNVREKYSNCYLNPQKDEIKKNFYTASGAIVLRPSVSEAPVQGHFATIEKLLLDLYLERERLDLFDTWEYETLFKRIAHHYRINIARFLRYADRRKIKEKIQGIIH